MNLTLTIIIPVFNEEGNLQVLFERLEKIREKLNSGNKISTNYIFVNDGSKDNSLNILEDLANDFSHLKIISFSRNFGHQHAISAGMQFSNSNFIFSNLTVSPRAASKPMAFLTRLSYLANSSGARACHFFSTLPSES